jgi:hypothetical protein
LVVDLSAAARRSLLDDELTQLGFDVQRPSLVDPEAIDVVVADLDLRPVGARREVKLILDTAPAADRMQVDTRIELFARHHFVARHVTSPNGRAPD